MSTTSSPPYTPPPLPYLHYVATPDAPSIAPIRRGKNHIVVGCRVYGFFGDLLPVDPLWVVANPQKHRRRYHERLYGTVVDIAGDHKWLIHFDN